MTLLELFRFLVPLFATEPDEVVNQALAVSVAYRPSCLSSDQQDAAQVWYAAHVMYSRAIQQAAAQTGSGGIVPANILSEKEGDLQRTYRSPGASASSSRTAGDPYGYYASWRGYAERCVGGAITVGYGRGRCCC